MLTALLSSSEELRVVAVFINMLKVYTEDSHPLFSSVKDSSKIGFSEFHGPQYNYHAFHYKDLSLSSSWYRGIQNPTFNEAQ